MSLFPSNFSATELDMLGIINAKVISKGRFGRMREIHLSIPISIESKVKKLVEEDLGLKNWKWTLPKK